MKFEIVHCNVWADGYCQHSYTTISVEIPNISTNNVEDYDDFDVKKVLEPYYVLEDVIINNDYDDEGRVTTIYVDDDRGFPVVELRRRF